MLRKLYKIMRKKFIPMSQYPDYLRKSGMKIVKYLSLLILGVNHI